jgi:hypothetical protein
MTGKSTEIDLRTTVYPTVKVALHRKKGPYTSIICYNFLLANEDIHGTVSMHRQIEQCLVILYPDFYCKKGRNKLYDIKRD